MRACVCLRVWHLAVGGPGKKKAPIVKKEKEMKAPAVKKEKEKEKEKEKKAPIVKKEKEKKVPAVKKEKKKKRKHLWSARRKCPPMPSTLFFFVC